MEIKADSSPESAWFAVQQKLFAFCSAVDRRQFHELRDVFLESATGDYGKGRVSANLADLLLAMEHNLGAGSNCGPSQHNVLNVRVALDEQGNWTSTAHFYAVHAGTGRWEGMLWKTWGQYEDLWEMTGNGLRIRHRQYTTFFEEGPGEIVSRVRD